MPATAPGPRIGSPTALLRYRPWRGRLHGPGRGALAIARVALGLMARRRLFWALYGLCVLVFLFYFFGQYLMVWVQDQLGEQTIPIVNASGNAAAMVRPGDLLRVLSRNLNLNGSGITFRNFIWWEGYLVMIVLALAGSVVVGNDFHHGSLAFYLAKPITRWHYVLGKGLAIAVFVNLMTTLPALALWAQYGLLNQWSYYADSFGLVLGILGYGAVLTVVLALLLLATASWLRRTVPMIMVWTSLFVFGRVLGNVLVEGLRFDPRWRLLDLWNNMYLLGDLFLRVWQPADSGIGLARAPLPLQPSPLEAALVLAGVCLTCLIDLNRRLHAVEIVQ
jgi:ABC-2 type transport system permease protein